MEKLLSLLTLVALLCLGTLAYASDFSYEGSFVKDDEVQLFNFSIGTTSNVTLRTFSFTGGVNAHNSTILSGGFDPIVALFGGSEPLKGFYINHNDDNPSNPPDPVTGDSWDSYLNMSLTPGSYTVALMQYGNFYKSGTGNDAGPVFTRLGQGNYTAALEGGTAGIPFWISDNEMNPPLGATQRDGHWAIDILNVQNSTLGSTIVTPEPVSSALFLLGGAALAIKKRKAKISA